MAFVHGKDTVVTLNSSDLSAFTNQVEFTQSADSHDVTTYGKDAHVFVGGLKNGTCTLSGVYDNTTSGPQDIIPPLIGTVVDLVFKPEGTGTGLPQLSAQVLVQDYTVTNPVADMVTWSCTLQLSDDVTSTNQT